MTNPQDALFDHLPREKILAMFEKADGKELQSGKFSSPDSSSALIANTLGLFIETPARLPAIPGTEALDWPACRVALEVNLRFPWAGGRHPWLDAVIETPTQLIGIESKRFEPFDTHGPPDISEAYWRPVWGERMARYERLRDELAEARWQTHHLDACQLVKHAFALRTQGSVLGKRPALIYLYTEPSSGRGGRAIKPDALATHRNEIDAFADAVASDEVAFFACSYSQLLTAFEKSGDPEIVDHARKIRDRFAP